MKPEPIGYVLHQIAPHYSVNYGFANTLKQAREIAYQSTMHYRRVVLSDPIPVYEVPPGWKLIETDALTVAGRFKRAWLAFRGLPLK